MDLFRLVNILIPASTLEEINESIGDVIQDKKFDFIFTNKELSKALQLLSFNSVNWEKALTRVRKEICCVAINANSKTKEKLIEFTISLKYSLTPIEVEYN